MFSEGNEKKHKILMSTRWTFCSELKFSLCLSLTLHVLSLPLRVCIRERERETERERERDRERERERERERGGRRQTELRTKAFCKIHIAK